jgi:hypothetical protein
MKGNEKSNISDRPSLPIEEINNYKLNKKVANE